MSHNHHDHSHHHNGKNLRIAFFLNLIFTVIEIIGGIYTNSLAILSDALHDLGDSFSLGLAWYFQKLSTKKRDLKYTYGYKRFSLLGAIVNSIVLIIGSFFIVKEAIPRIISPETADAKGMFFLAILGILFNGAAFLRTRDGHSHNEKVVSLHLLEDVLGWVAILLGSLVIYFTGWYQIDPILSVLIALFILFNVYRNIKSSLRIILQATPEDVDLEEIRKSLKNIPGVKSSHDLHVWSLDGEKNIMTSHVVLENDLKEEDRLKLRNKIKESVLLLKIHHCTIEFEMEGAHGDIDCDLES